MKKFGMAKTENHLQVAHLFKKKRWTVCLFDTWPTNQLGIPKARKNQSRRQVKRPELLCLFECVFVGNCCLIPKCFMVFCNQNICFYTCFCAFFALLITDLQEAKRRPEQNCHTTPVLQSFPLNIEE